MQRVIMTSTPYYTRYRTFSLSLTWIGHNTKRYHNLNVLIYALPYILSKINMVWGLGMISYFIVAHCTFMKNFSSKLKSQFQVIFDQDSFPLEMSQFQASLLHNFKNRLLANGWWNTCFYHYSSFTKKFPIFSRKHLVCRKIFLLCRTDSFGGLPRLFFCNH